MSTSTNPPTANLHLSRFVRDVSKPSDARRGIDRVLDLYHWFDLYQPEIQIG